MEEVEGSRIKHQVDRVFIEAIPEGHKEETMESISE
jgi:hypothetical protein